MNDLQNFANLLLARRSNCQLFARACVQVYLTFSLNQSSLACPVHRLVSNLIGVLLTNKCCLISALAPTDSTRKTVLTNAPIKKIIAVLNRTLCH